MMRIKNIEKFSEINAIVNFLIYECKINSLCKVSFLSLSIYNNNFKLASLVGGVNKYELIEKLIKYSQIKNLSANEDYRYILNILNILQIRKYIAIQSGSIVTCKESSFKDYSACKYLSNELKQTILKEINTFSDESFLSEVMKYV